MEASQRVQDLVNGVAKGTVEQEGSPKERKAESLAKYKADEKKRVADMHKRGKDLSAKAEADKKKALEDDKAYRKKEQDKIAKIKDEKMQKQIQEQNRKHAVAKTDIDKGDGSVDASNEGAPPADVVAEKPADDRPVAGGSAVESDSVQPEAVKPE